MDHSAEILEPSGGGNHSEPTTIAEVCVLMSLSYSLLFQYNNQTSKERLLKRNGFIGERDINKIKCYSICQSYYSVVILNVKGSHFLNVRHLVSVRNGP